MSSVICGFIIVFVGENVLLVWSAYCCQSRHLANFSEFIQVLCELAWFKADIQLFFINKGHSTVLRYVLYMNWHLTKSCDAPVTKSDIQSVALCCFQAQSWWFGDTMCSKLENISKMWPGEVLLTGNCIYLLTKIPLERSINWFHSWMRSNEFSLQFCAQYFIYSCLGS